jgi:hypothetical protein
MQVMPHLFVTVQTTSGFTAAETFRLERLDELPSCAPYNPSARTINFA